MAPWTIFTTIHNIKDLSNFQMGLISLSVTLHSAWKACQGQAL